MKRSPSPSSSSSTSSCIAPRRSRGKRTREVVNVPAGSTKRSSIYRGVTRHRWTGRYEAHLWDKNAWNSFQKKKGRQIYLGAYDDEAAAARTYDLAALKYWGHATKLNFPIETYAKEVEGMGRLSKEEYLASLRRRSSGFSRGVSKYRGVARHHHNGRWEARIGRVRGSKYLYLGTYATQEEAAVAYDLAAIEYRGSAAITNFDISTYADKFKQMHQPEPEPQPQPKKEIAADIEEIAGAEQFGSAIMIDPMEEQWNMRLNEVLTEYPFDQEELPDLFSGSGFVEDIGSMFEDEFKLESAECSPKVEITSPSSSSTLTASALSTPPS